MNYDIIFLAFCCFISGLLTGGLWGCIHAAKLIISIKDVYENKIEKLTHDIHTKD